MSAAQIHEMASNNTSETNFEKNGLSSETTPNLSKEHLPKDDSVLDDGNLHYDNGDVEPEIHFRTYVALFAMFMLNFVSVVALQGPPAVVSALLAYNDALIAHLNLAQLYRGLLG
jgi:hypothetical protein